MKLNLLNILKNVIVEQGPIGLYEPYDADDPEYFDYSTIDSESGEIKKLEKPIDPVLDPNIESSTNSIDVDGLDQSNIIKASSVRGKTYGWREPIPRLCSPVKPRYCKWHWHAGRDYSGGGVGFGTPTATLKSGTMGKIGGTCFEINHDDGSKTKHCHYSKLFFKTGDRIPAGAIFQNVGNTQPSTGPHEHFEYYPPGATERVEKKHGEQKTVKDVDPATIDDKYIVFIKNKDKYLEDVKKFQFLELDTKRKETPKDDKKSEDKKTTDNGSKKTITKSSYIIQLGDPSSKKFNIIWGGTSSKVYGANFMKEQGDQYLSDKNIIYSDWENSVSKLKEKLKESLGDGYTIRSVSGFSKGGEKTWNEINSGYDFVGLIDPSTSFARTSLPSNVKMMSNHSNWGAYPKMKEAIKKMEENGLSERIGDSKTYNHDSIPKKFFERYSGNY